MNSKYKRIGKGFWQLADPKIWIASTIPIGVGTALAYNLTGKFNFYWFIITLIGIYLIEIGKNAVNEVIDYKSGVDKYVTPKNRTPFSGGKKTIVDGILKIKEVIIIAFLTMGTAAVIGLYITFFREKSVLIIGIIGFLLSIIYSVPPFKLCYRGLGEITVGITFGPLITIGSYLVQAGSFHIFALIVSLPLGLLIANVLVINQFPDYYADKKGNKNNLVVKMGRKKAVKLYQILYILTFISIIINTFLIKSLFWLLPLLAIPFAIKSVKIAQKYYNEISHLKEANKLTIQIYQIVGLTYIIASILDYIF